MLFTLDSTSNLDKRTQNRQNSRPSRSVVSFFKASVTLGASAPNDHRLRGTAHPFVAT